MAAELNLHSALAVIDPLVRRIGERLVTAHKRGSGFQVMHKGPSDLVTELDLWSEEEISRTITATFPGSTIIGEESAHRLVEGTSRSLEELSANGACWFVDPIDGTTNFVSGIPHFSISIGLTIDGARVFGAVYDPMRDELFTAVRGEGARLNREPISASVIDRVEHAVIATDFPPDQIVQWGHYIETHYPFLKNVRSHRHFGSAALDLCWLACGRLDGHFVYGVKSWDIAAGSLIVEEAGGRAGHISDHDVDSFSLFSRDFLFAGSALYERMRTLIRSKR